MVDLIWVYDFDDLVVQNLGLSTSSDSVVHHPPPCSTASTDNRNQKTFRPKKSAPSGSKIK
ncbi:hypothetical protein QJS10_CPB19g00598 [Acorus calamus]|uniref:Uncharacterized protein n=1 Tax=Acorus calamus TaxID=4465 RepID=A0AAV9CH73_ACOCL|nr:hypothetical protein QJS10_CPB19g00598 [Acorus calamus]